METGLTPDNSDLIALIESQLLGTELHVNGDESMLMADGLLDLEPDTMPLSQSTPGVSNLFRPRASLQLSAWAEGHNCFSVFKINFQGS